MLTVADQRMTISWLKVFTEQSAPELVLGGPGSAPFGVAHCPSSMSTVASASCMRLRALS